MKILHRITLSVILLLTISVSLKAENHRKDDSLLVGIAGSNPFVVDTVLQTGISLEIWAQVMQVLDIPYKTKTFEDIPQALTALEQGKIDAVAGPVSITSERALRVSFTQPYFQSGFSILSLKHDPSLLQRITPFFSEKFFLAVGGFLFILGIVGTLLWLAERKKNSKHFPRSPARGIANGMWCAIVTMATIGYGDVVPTTLLGRLIAGIWIVISLVLATTMIAGIASTFTLTGMQTTTIATSEELKGKKIGAVFGSPAYEFTEIQGARTIKIENLKEGFDKLLNHQIDGIVDDRPQLLYFNQQYAENEAIVSIAEYERQGFGFAFPQNSKIVNSFSIELLRLQETGLVNNIERRWLGIR